MTTTVAPLVGLGLGATASAIGAGGLAAVLWGSPTLSRRDRWTVGAAMALLIGSGAALSAISQVGIRRLD